MFKFVDFGLSNEFKNKEHFKEVVMNLELKEFMFGIQLNMLYFNTDKNIIKWAKKNKNCWNQRV